MASNPAPIEVVASSNRPLGMPPARFLRDYWQKRPLLIRNAFAGFRNPVAPDDLAGLACEEFALSRIVLHDPRRDRWTLRTGPFAESDFARLPATHWTLLVQDVDKWDADVAALLQPFAFLPSWRIDDVMISYAEDHGSVGAHVDQYDVFLLQGLGRRRWQISNDPAAPTAFRDDAELKLLREFTPTHDWVLEPGDMLYLPPGVPHHGIALGACMTYSIGMRAPSQAELVGDFVDHLVEAMPEDARYVDADLQPSRGDGEIDDAAIARVMQAMPWLRWPSPTAALPPRTQKQAPARGARDSGAGDLVGGPLLRDWFGRFITRYRSAQIVAANPRPLTDAAFDRAVAAGAELQRNPWSRCAWMRDGRAAALFVAGERHACSTALARRVCGSPRFALGAVRNANDRMVLRALIDAGHLAIMRPGKQRSGR